MSNDIQIFNGLKIKEVNGQVMFDAETAAIGIGLSFVAKSGNEVVRWERVNKYLGIDTSVEKIKRGDFITEPQFYKLVIKTNSPVADKFQDWVTEEVLPSIRKTGGYQVKQMTPMELLETQYEALKDVDAAQKELRNEFTDLKEQFGLPNDFRKRFTKARNKRVIEIMGGYYGTAYGNKKLRSAVYRELSNYVKDRFQIGEYANLPLSRFDEAMRLIGNWQPSEVTSLAIEGANQTVLEV